MIRAAVLQRSVEFMSIIAVIAMVATIILFTQIYQHDTAQKIQRDYELCQSSNQRNAGLRSLVDSDRAMTDHVAPATQPDLSTLQDPQLRQLAQIVQALNRDFRAKQLEAEQQQLDKFAPRDCEAERDNSG